MLKIIKTENGYVRGIGASDPRVSAFKGIPFAAPPVGDLRWRAPRPVKSWEGVRDGIEFAPISMQNIPGLNREELYSREWNVDPEIPMSEDCLYLNIWTPAQKEDEKLPVYVWYFGGALQFGNTAEMEFDGERLARRGIVVVSVNYRINVFGFLAHPELTREAPEAPANFGNLDQQYGLFWVKRNIEAFGGDSDNITIGGQSAGGGSVLTQLNCPANEGYIQKAFIQSGMFLNPYEEGPYKTLQEMEKQGVEFFDYLGVETLAKARSLPAELIRDKNEEFQKYWWTATDGVFQKDTYMNSLLRGKLPDIPLLMGHTNNEFFEELEAEDPIKMDRLIDEKFGVLGESFKKIIQDENGDFQSMIHNTKVHTIKLAELSALQAMEKCGKKAPHYHYEFGVEIPGWDHPGAFHSSDLWFFFETLQKCWRPFQGKHYDLARHMCNYLANFIKTGNPNGLDSDGNRMEEWPSYTQQEPVTMTFYDQSKPMHLKNNEIIQFLLEYFDEFK